jgi:hypothetical protein
VPAWAGMRLGCAEPVPWECIITPGIHIHILVFMQPRLLRRRQFIVPGMPT